MTPWGSTGSGAGRRRSLPLDNRTLIILGRGGGAGRPDRPVAHASAAPSSSTSSSWIPSIIFHEISHGAVALAFGDRTAKRAGGASA